MMQRTAQHLSGRGALELIEEATHLLRTAPSSVLALYGIGALPFLLGLLWFWGDMSRNPFARQHAIEASLCMAVLFAWMKFWQALFARGLHSAMIGEAVPMTWRDVVRVLTAQTVLQSAGLFLLPLTLVVVLPFAWTYQYFQSVTALGCHESGSVRKLFKKACGQAARWPGQNIALLVVMAGFGAFVFLGWTITCAVMPSLLKMLLGVETTFSRSPFAVLNTTFLMAMFCLTYLSVDPILKAVAVLRCFYGESQQTGEDLRAELRHLRGKGALVAAIVLLISGMAMVPIASAAKAAPENPAVSTANGEPQALSPSDLDRSINEVIGQRKYVWRMPREGSKGADTGEKGVIGRFIDDAAKKLRQWTIAIRDWMDKWMRKLFQRERVSREHDGYGWMVKEQLLLYGLGAIVLLALAFLLYRVWRERNRRATGVVADAIQPTPDLKDENVGADQLPEDGWTRLAREMLARGEFRLALRAFYLGSLAHLAGRNLITLARFKSNRDYERELQRRGHALAEMLPLFAENVSVFDRCWYGMYSVDGDLVSRFAVNVERIKASA